ncbi:hypothetical protein HOC99_02540 [Candidatus Woesearchaeota archaeon]|jgi:hypothetical protein|nr:hypothetical protein [Candidatus Woesearchaeota archaeon]MBT4387410.1 hypothetical protein [Candidatus Woesearchaeota archaeon]MBT4595787.1 hypothetical protein [Candidatus Woesearchaeota archaeon]MBT5741364.1 hypothetical protein [Candidatus Woesearchaeota archaeon]MBT7848861.1 hypothetical protein [Candidatus Woesearchaeota archaeon]
MTLKTLYRDSRKYFYDNWNLTKDEVLIVFLFFITYIFLIKFLLLNSQSEIIPLISNLLIILFVLIYYTFFKNKNIFTFSLFFALIWTIFSVISPFTLENLVYSYFTMPFLLLVNCFFISGYYLLFKYKTYWKFVYAFLCMFVSIYIFDLIKFLFLKWFDIFSSNNLNSALLIYNPVNIFSNNFEIYLFLSLLLGLPCLMHAKWIKNYFESKPILTYYYIGLAFSLLLVFRNLLGLIILVKDQYLFSQLLFNEFTINLFGFNYLIIFSIFGMLNYFFNN